MAHQKWPTGQTKGEWIMDIIWDIIWLAICLAPVVGLYKIFEKMGEAGWKSIIPIMNVYIWAGKTGLKWWFMFIPFLNFYLFVMLALNTAKAFGKSTGYGFGLLFLPFVFLPMLGFDKDATFTPIAKDNA